MSGKRILIVDDEEGVRTVLADLFSGLGWQSTVASDGKEALDKALKNDYDLAILDLSLPGVDGIELLRTVKDAKPEIPVVIITGYASLDTAVRAMKLGAYDYITKPFNLDDVQLVAERAIERRRLIDENSYLKNEMRVRYGFDNVVGRSPAAQKAYVMAAKIADSSASVLILGETGTGKEYLARAIHYQSPRANDSFIKVSCAALPESLLESELFGHEKGAFTGAVTRKPGRFDLADGGTMFLDEIGDTTAATQIKLLRVLQEKQFERLGGTETLTVDVRIIAATNRDLKQAIAEKSFREDLYYRLNVVTLNLPSLRERKEDIPELVRHFIHKYCDETGKNIDGISPEALSMLENCSWPGNIRELENCIERAVILCNGRMINKQHLLLSDENPHSSSAPEAVALRSLREVEDEHIRRVLEECEYNQSRAAAILDIDRKTLRKRVRELGLGTEIAGSSPDHAA